MARGVRTVFRPALSARNGSSTRHSEPMGTITSLSRSCRVTSPGCAAGDGRSDRRGRSADFILRHRNGSLRRQPALCAQGPRPCWRNRDVAIEKDLETEGGTAVVRMFRAVFVAAARTLMDGHGLVDTRRVRTHHGVALRTARRFGAGGTSDSRNAIRSPTSS